MFLARRSGKFPCYNVQDQRNEDIVDTAKVLFVQTTMAQAKGVGKIVLTTWYVFIFSGCRVQAFFGRDAVMTSHLIHLGLSEVFRTHSSVDGADPKQKTTFRYTSDISSTKPCLQKGC